MYVYYKFFFNFNVLVCFERLKIKLKVNFFNEH
jgi:hypothetical protein